MTAPYRNEQDALRDRKAHLEEELARVRAQTTELEALRAAEVRLAQEVAQIDQKLGGRRALPMLDQVQVASPCSANWDDMVGDARVRFCLSCEKNVYNLSQMSALEAEALLQSRASSEICVRFYRRADGTVMTSDCPVGVTRKRRKKLALAVAGAGALAAAAVTSVMSGRRCGVTQGEVMGAMPVPVTVIPEAPSATTPPEPPAPVPEMGGPKSEMGAPKPARPHVMGRMPARR